ncbi:alkaline phosphatase 4 [Lucilia cuprina]|uniref:alkaline phosphatase 4 n=1 Tax=Lucilia cuprina TaxID=7375 RepID=UPI001F06E29D|nr:alkaline phosphatase 4 [Lucilia cuprina]
MLNLKFVCIFGILTLSCVFGGITTNLPPTAIRTLNATDVGPEFVAVEQQPSPRANTDYDKDDKNIEDAQFWYNTAFKQLGKIIKNAQKNKENAYKRKAKNIIVFVGDGMGLTTITAGRIYKGQYLKHGHGEEEMLAFDEFPYTGLAKTYNVDKQVPDSAGTATAMFCGSKSDYGAIGMDTTRSKTDGKQGRLTSIMDWAQAENKRTGIVTTTRITHATPAATYANIYHRDWECDNKVPDESKPYYVDIARQLVETNPGNKFNVIMGGGLKPLGAANLNEVRTVEFEGDTEDICSRSDGLNLPQKWLDYGKSINDSRVFVKSIKELKEVDLKKVNSLMGLFRNNHITYSIAKEEGEPSLKEMTEAAIEVLERGTNSNGYVLLVEGGRIDQAHHQNYAHTALHELFEFDKAIAAAIEKTNADETLILVTADHSHSVTLNGYPKRGANILGLANKTSDPYAYETIMYANGPGFYEHLANGTVNTGSPTDIWLPLTQMTKEQRDSPTYRHMATVPLKDESHGGEDVIVFAHGPGSSLVRGVFEQNYLAFIMSYAGCMGPAKTFDETCKSGAVTVTVPVFLLLAVCLMHFIRKF